MSVVTGKHISVPRLLVPGLLVMVAAACASPNDKPTDKFIYASGRPVYQAAEEQGQVARTLWESGEYGYVRIVQAEAGGGGNQHPVNLSPDQIRAALSQVQIQKRGDNTEPVFNDTELDALDDPLAKALGEAGPGQDVTFAISARKGPLKLLAPLSVTTGRLFYQDGRLNLIFGMVNDTFGSELRATGVLQPFTPGSRGREADLGPELAAAGPVRFAPGREDWVRIPGNAVATAAPVPQPGFYQPSTQQPLGPQPGFQPSPPAPRQDSDQVYLGDDGRYQTIEERLRVLQGLYLKGLITDQEYQAKRQAIISEL